MACSSCLQLLLSKAQLLANPSRKGRQQVRFKSTPHNDLTPFPQARLTQAKSRQHSSEWMDQNLAETQHSRDSACQLSGRSSIGHKRACTNVVTTKQRHLLNGISHRFHREIKRSLRKRLRIASQSASKLPKALPYHLQIRTQILRWAEHWGKGLHLQTT